MLEEKILASVAQNGFYNTDIDPTLDLFEAINKLKKEKNAVVLAHYYQEADIQDILTFIVESKIKCDFFYAKSGNEAIQLIESGQKIDLIISDFNMPNGNGGHLYSYLTKNC